MSLRRDVHRWLVYAIAGSVCLIIGQLAWVIKLETRLDHGLRDNYNFQRENSIQGSTIQHVHRRMEPSSNHANYSTFHQQIYPFNDKQCIPDLRIFSQNIRTPFKIYVYDLPAKFNKDILACLKKWPCFQLEYCGMGPELYRQGNASVRHTNQFSLEVILHHQMLFSEYRTLNPEEADVFYIPAYSGLACFCYDHQHSHDTKSLVAELFNWLNQQQPYVTEKLHISALAKIQREQASKHCPLLNHPESEKVIYATIEEEASKINRQHHRLESHKVIVVPYPSYSHVVQGSQGQPRVDHMNVTSHKRRVFILLAAGSRRSNMFRAKLIDQFDRTARTVLAYEEFFRKPENGHTDMVMLITRECNGNHHYTTVPWMQHSVFCLQPPGDSPTRKSFYDAIQAGCIPVLFQDSDSVRYPFQASLNYKDITVTLPLREVDEKNLKVRELLQELTLEDIHTKQDNIEQLAKRLQFSWPTGSLLHENDALKSLIDGIAQIVSNHTFVK